MAFTFCTSTRKRAASKPTEGWLVSSRTTNSTWQPLTPPALLTWSTASLPASAMTLPIAPCAPVRASTPPSLGQSCCAAAWPLTSMNKEAAAGTASWRRVGMVTPEVEGKTEPIQPARRAPSKPCGTQQQGQHQDQADQDGLQGAALGLPAGRQHEADERAGQRPQAPDNEGAGNGAAVAAAAADDQHGPDLEGDDRQEVAGAGGADEAGIQRARQAHQHRAEHEAGQAQPHHVLAQRGADGLRLRAWRAAPGPRANAAAPAVRRSTRPGRPATIAA